MDAVTSNYYLCVVFLFLKVNPLYDHGGITSVMAANLLYEMLCVLPGVKYQNNCNS